MCLSRFFCREKEINNEKYQKRIIFLRNRKRQMRIRNRSKRSRLK